MPKVYSHPATARDQFAPGRPEAPPAPLPRENRNRFDAEGDLVSKVFGGYAVLMLDECELEQMIAFYFKTRRDMAQSRSFGRVRVSVEIITE